MNNELLAVVEYMERERGIAREVLIEAVEAALVSASKKGSGGDEQELRVEVDPKTLDIRAYTKVKVVNTMTRDPREIPLVRAQNLKADVKPGDTIEILLPPEKFGRIAAQTAKQAILHKIRQAEKTLVFEEFKDRSGDIISGTVRRFDRNDVVIELTRGEGVMNSRERVPTEEYQVGDRIRAFVLRVEDAPSGPMIQLSRSHPDFVKRLFEIEVSEIADETVEIRGIAREAGYRSKVAVQSKDDKVDPVGACVGLRGIRVKNIVRELGGEKIDIVRWADDPKTYIANALAPAKLRRIDLDEETGSVTVMVDEDQLSLAIGKKGQNARLTAKLTGWKIDIQREQAEGEEDFKKQVALVIERLSAVEGIGPDNAEALVYAGFLSLEGILAAELDDLCASETIDEALAISIKKAAEVAYEKEHGSLDDDV